ncbi:MAG TPA: hypothetical protein VF871_04855 [Burkholderiales bacterium]
MATHLPRILFFALIAIFIWPSLAPAQRPPVRPAVLVNPHVQGNGTVTTIQEGIDMVAPGGKVMVLPGTYDEAIVIDKGLTLEAVGSGSVIVAPPEVTNPALIAVRIDTNDPVTIRGITVQYTGGAGIRGDGPVDLTIERATLLAVNPPLGATALVSVRRNVVSETQPKRARLVVRHSMLDGSITCSTWHDACTIPTNRPPMFPQIFGIILGFDVDAVLEENVIRRAGGGCIFVVMRDDLGGGTNVDIVGNDLDECHPLGRAGSIVVGTLAGVPLPSPTHPVTATGEVNIVGNTIHNSSLSCLTTSAIVYEVFTGRIERNRILSVVQPCATPSLRGLPAAVWVGSLPARGFPRVNGVTVRFNNIEGNAQAGLRVAPNMSSLPIDASCNWWGSASGPSGAGGGSGDAVVVETGATTPTFMPWAIAPIAETDETTCTD